MEVLQHHVPDDCGTREGLSQYPNWLVLFTFWVEGSRPLVYHLGNIKPPLRGHRPPSDSLDASAWILEPPLSSNRLG